MSWLLPAVKRHLNWKDTLNTIFCIHTIQFLLVCFRISQIYSSSVFIPLYRFPIKTQPRTNGEKKPPVQRVQTVFFGKPLKRISTTHFLLQHFVDLFLLIILFCFLLLFSLFFKVISARKHFFPPFGFHFLLI